MAEGEGFEPPDPCGSPVFKTGAINQLDHPSEGCGDAWNAARRKQKAGTKSRLDEAPVALEELSIHIEGTALAQVFNHVPVQGGVIYSASLGIGRAHS